MTIDYWQTLKENAYYHIYNRTNGNALLFCSHDNYQFFLQKWQLYFDDYLDTYAYCLMSNHFHFIVKVKPFDDAFKAKLQTENTVAAKAFIKQKITLDAFLEDQFKRFFTSYAKAFNKQQKRHGSLFEKRFKRVELKTPLQLLEKIAYVHHNPLHHDLSPFYDSWQYSSYSTYLSNKPTKLKRQEGLWLFDKLRGSLEVFILYHQDYDKRWVQSKGRMCFEDEMDYDI